MITLPGPRLPRTGGYRVLAGRRELTRLLTDLAPDRIEVSDRSTLRWTGRWARERGVPSMMVSHESLAGLLGVWGMPDPLRRPPPTGSTGRPPRCTTRSSAPPRSPPPSSAGSACRNLAEVPLGVDLDEFHPAAAPTPRSAPGTPRPARS